MKRIDEMLDGIDHEADRLKYHNGRMPSREELADLLGQISKAITQYTICMDQEIQHLRLTIEELKDYGYRK